ncbi:MAG: FmdB family zinc ribbon protein [Planctomycetota bacterium]
MPTYEYECTKCGRVTELFQSITEAPRRKLRKTDPRECKCNATVRRRIGTGGGLIFKGSGFYLTDYRSEGYKKAASAESDSSSGKDKPAAGGDGKVADKKPSKPKKAAE